MVAIVGPTAVGKSGLAMELARQLDAVIISADSRQVYRYMDIGTAKPSRDEQSAVQHFMIDLVEPSDTYSAQRYAQEGSRVLKTMGARGRTVLVVGGTGFYVRALLDGLAIPNVPPDPQLRERLREEADRLGPGPLHRRLAEKDPVSAARVHPHNLPRLIRALEIIERTGGPVPRGAVAASVPALYIGLTHDRVKLKEVADRRVRAQVRSGLVEETEWLLQMGYDPASPPLAGFAYSQMMAFLRGERTLEGAIADYQTATHQYIRRQYTWFNRDSRIHWLDARNAQRDALTQIEVWLENESIGASPSETEGQAEAGSSPC